MKQALLLLAVSTAACSGSSAASAPPPSPPASGAPIAFEVTGFTPGADHDGKVAVKAYNFAPKAVAAYAVAVRYTDKAGQPLKVGVGTSFEKDVAWTSMTGNHFKCAAKSWCAFDIEGIEVPASTAKAEVAATKVRALNGGSFEEAWLWESPGGMAEWPASK